MMSEGTVEVVEIFTRKKWYRRVGDGPTEEVDLRLYGGVVPFIFLSNTIDWVKQTKFVGKRELG